MASVVYNHGSTKLQDRTIDFVAGTIKLMLVDNTYVPNKDEQNLTTAAAKEISVSGYARVTLGSKTITEDDTNDRTVYAAANPATYTLASGQTIGGWVVFYDPGTGDANCIPLFFNDCNDTPTNGGTFNAVFDANGIGYTQQ